MTSSADPALFPSSPCRFMLVAAALLVACGDVVGPADENDGAGSTPSSGARTSRSTTPDDGASSGGTSNSRAPGSGESTCKSGVVTGSVCNPAVDLEDCVRTSRTCQCTADEQWLCEDTMIVAQGGTSSRTSQLAATGSRATIVGTTDCLGVVDDGDCEASGDGAVCDRSDSTSNPRMCTCTRKGNDYTWSCQTL